MKKDILFKSIYIFIMFFIVISQVTLTYAVTDFERDQSISGIIQDGSSFIELR